MPCVLLTTPKCVLTLRQGKQAQAWAIRADPPQENLGGLRGGPPWCCSKPRQAEAFFDIPMRLLLHCLDPQEPHAAV
jgi:hypothetical protein